MGDRRVSIPDLLEVQTVPYEEFLRGRTTPSGRQQSGLDELFRRVFPVHSEDGLLTLDYVACALDEPVESVDECVERRSTYESRLKVTFRLIARTKAPESGELQPRDTREQTIYIGTIPLMTERGTFIINGIERVVVNQLLRCPGVYFKEEGTSGRRTLYSAKILPARGLWIEFSVETKQNKQYLVVNLGKKKIHATVLLKALGYSEDEIKSMIYPDGQIPQDSLLVNTFAVDGVAGHEEALRRIYAELKPNYPVIDKETTKFFRTLFFTTDTYDLSEAGRAQIRKKLGTSTDDRCLTPEDIIGTVRYLVNLIERGSGTTEDIDHLGNKRVRVAAEVISEHIYEGLLRMARFTRERMLLVDKTAPLNPQELVNSKVFITAVNEFFGRNQLSQFLDQCNPLSELTHKRRVTAVGEGGVKERKRAGFEVRDVHYTHFGRICPIETPEGANIGLINSLTVHARVDHLGFIRTPYYRVVDGRVTQTIDYLSADEEEKHVVAPPDVPYDPDTGRIIPDEVTVRGREGDFIRKRREQIEYIGISPVQIVSASASLIPFLEHDDSNRALMGSNMQRQAVPILRAEPPLVRTGMEKVVVRDSRVAVTARRDGVVVRADGREIVVAPDNPGLFPWQKEDTYRLINFRRTNQDTCFHQRPVVRPGDRVRKGQILSDGPCVARTGDLALGRNVTVAFLPWHGYNYEDAIILSERLVRDDMFTSIHIAEFEVEARETELGNEEITADIPNVSEDRLKNLGPDGIIRVGAEVQPDDILVGKITPRGESELTPEEKLLRVIFGEKAKDVQNTSLRVPPGIRGVVVNVRVYERTDNNPDREKAKKLQEALSEKIARLKEEYAGRKSVVKKILVEEMKSLLERNHLPYRVTANMETWEVVAAHVPESLRPQFAALVEMGKSELEKLERQERAEEARIRRGPELDTDVICKVVVEIAMKKKISVGDKMSGRHGNKGVVARILPEEDMPFLSDGTPVDMILNPLGVPSRMNVGQILETHLGWALRAMGKTAETPIFQSVKELEIRHMLRQAGLSEDGKTVLYDGLTGEPFAQPVTVGSMYMMKLIHLADEKIHARCTGPYSLITQQPLGGRAQFGGQRFGEMEVWALEGYGAAHTLREILTVKSDDTEGRKQVYESIAKGLDYRGEHIPESFNVLKKELQGLGLDMRIERHGDTTEERVTIRIAPPMVIRSWSHGEVRKSETLNYRNFKPERDGLFCERIFGPTRDFECACGKYKKMRYKGIICDRCGVEITTSRVRRERMGHIELACPVSYVWLFKSTSNWMGTLLEMSQNDLEVVLYYEKYIVTDPGDTPLKERQILDESEYQAARARFGNRFRAGIGAEAIQELLKKIDLQKEEEKLRSRLLRMKRGSNYGHRRALVKRLRMVQGLLRTQVKPEYMITSIIPVIPPDLRPLLPLDGGRFVASDLNDLYMRVINRNNRLKKLLKLQAPDIIIRNEKRMLQEAVDALMDNGRHGAAVLGKGKRPLKSLSDALRGKQGRFRQNLLGKRVDYSGRAVIVIGPELKLNECGVPKEMALELFSPFVLRELRKREYFHTLGSAKRALAENRPEVWEILEQVSRNHPVFLNRQPTLHRLSIQAFEPRLIEGNVIRLHPLVCSAYNADFDGDTMSIHVPLSVEAQTEAELLIKATTHILSPASGHPVLNPTRDIVLGCYYLTYQSEEEKYPGVLSGFEEAKLLHHFGLLELHRPVSVRENGKILTTTAGRIIFNEVLPPEIPFKNMLFTHETLAGLIGEIFAACGYQKTVEVADAIKDLGFAFATIGGITIGIDDMRVPEEKMKRVSEAREEVLKVERNYRKGIISEGERYNRIIDIWTSVTNDVSDAVIKGLAADTSVKPFRLNPIIAMVSSGARGNRSQINQLMGMRGLMIRPSKKATGGIGEIITEPVVSNFREGLNLLEYFISVHGGRKGLVDTALKTSDAGYLSRRLVDVAHSVIITEEDCGTSEGIVVGPLSDGEEELLSLRERILGRVASQSITDPVSDTVIVSEGEVIDEKKADAIVNLGFPKIRVRSPLTCRARVGVCAKCYGWDLSRRRLVNLGEAVGIIAAQSIGEPGTQLTLRTFHTGGAASRGTGETRILARESGTVHYDPDLVRTDRDGNTVVVRRSGKIVVRDDERNREIDAYTVRVGTFILVPDGKKVRKGDEIARWDPYSIPIITDRAGRVKLQDVVMGVTARREKESDRETGVTPLVIIEHEEEKEPQILILDTQGKVVADFHLPTGAHLLVRDGSLVKEGDVLAKTPRTLGRVQDITGGLPRVSELFEARAPRNPAILSEIDGEVEVRPAERGTRTVVVFNTHTNTRKEYQIPFGKHIRVLSGDHITAGTPLTDGPSVLGDILRIQGEKKVQEYLLNEVQKVYAIEGVTISDKHIEIIIRQMLSRVRVEDPGDTFLLEGEEVDRNRIQEDNEALPKGKRPASYKPLVLGITRVALSSDSFISAASFQETMKVLTNAAVLGSEDHLRGLKENVILGKLIPAGTGYASRLMRSTGETAAPQPAEVAPITGEE